MANPKLTLLLIASGQSAGVVRLCLANNEPIPLPVECDVLPSGKWLQRVPRTLHKQLIECADARALASTPMSQRV